MGFRFRKSVKLLPGVRVNLSKRGLSSLSVGPRGAKINIGPRGSRATVSAPGTGLSYSTSLSSGSGRSAPTTFADGPQRRVGLILFVGILFLPYVFTWLLLRRGHSVISRLLGFGWLAFMLFRHFAR